MLSMLAGGNQVGGAMQRSPAQPRMGDKCTGPYTLSSLVGNVLCQPGVPL
jgi:hypothetical protein